MKRMLVSLGAALATLLCASTGVQADSIPWGYSATSPPAISASTSPLSSVNFSGSSGVASGNSGIIIYNLTTASSAPDASPDSFNNVPFNLAVNLTDIKATGSSAPGATPTGSVNFSGLFNASNVTTKSLLPGATTWTQVGSNISPVEASVVLGSSDTGWRNYDVLLSSFTAPGQPGGAPGSIQAIVTITPATGPGPGPGTGGNGDPQPSGTPEPATLILAGLGLPFVVLMRRRLKKDAV
jgi:hypothetical protein